MGAYTILLNTARLPASGESREINFTTDAVPGVAPDSAMDGRGQTNGVDSEQSEDDSGGALDAEKW